MKKRPEERIHRMVVQYLQLMLPKPYIFWSTPNQRGTRKAWEVSLLKGLGVRAGIPDLFVAGPGKVIALEVKAEKGKLSPVQKSTIGALAEAGIPTIVVRSIEEAEEALKALGVPLKGRAM